MCSFHNSFTNHIIYLLFTTFSIYSSLEAKNGEWCNFCDAPEHSSEDDLCTRCGEKVKDCEYYHSIAEEGLEEMAQRIINSPDIESIITTTMKIRDMMRSDNVFINVDDTCDMTIKYFIENGVPIQKNHINDLKRLLNASAFKVSFGYSLKKPIEPVLPREVKFGFLIGHAGLCMSILPWKPAKLGGKVLMAYGTQMTISGYYEYGCNLNDYYASLEEYENDQAEIKKEKEAKDAEKQARRTAEKEEKEERRRVKAIEKQQEKEEKEVRRRQKEERRKNEQNK